MVSFAVLKFRNPIISYSFAFKNYRQTFQLLLQNIQAVHFQAGQAVTPVGMVFSRLFISEEPQPESIHIKYTVKIIPAGHGLLQEGFIKPDGSVHILYTKIQRTNRTIHILPLSYFRLLTRYYLTRKVQPPQSAAFP